MIYKISSVRDMLRSEGLKATSSIDFRTDDTIEAIVVSWSWTPGSLDELLANGTPEFAYELSFISEPQTEISDTQGQILTLYASGGGNTMMPLAAGTTEQAPHYGFSHNIYVPVDSVKVQSGERLYMTLSCVAGKPTAVDLTVRAVTTIYTKAGGTDRAIRRR